MNTALTAPIDPEAISALARQVGGSGEGPFVELVPSGTVRTFRVGETVVRFDQDPSADGLPAAVRAMTTLRQAVTPALVPELAGHGRAVLAGEERPWLAYAWLNGPTLTVEQAKQRPERLGRLLANLHGARVFDLLFRFERQRPMTLMDSFKSVSDRLRGWLLAREADGLNQDLLTLTLSDLQRAMRQYAMAQDHHFRTMRRRVLLHGRPRPSAIVALGAPAEGGDLDDEQLFFVNLEEACLGDSAEDAAALSVACQYTPDEETDFLSAYTHRLEELDRPDPRFLLRFFPRRFLLQINKPVASLHRMLRIKRGEEDTVGDPVAALEDMIDRTYGELQEAINGLRGFVGGMRTVSVDEVKAMGRLLAYEELLLRDRSFRLVVTGLPYAGKTEVGASIARRLDHAYVNTSVLGRAVAAYGQLLELEDGKPDELPPPPERVALLFDRGLELQPLGEPPYYRVRIGGRDVTDLLRSDPIALEGATLLDDEGVREALAGAIAQRFAPDGVVIEGAYAAELAPGRARVFHLVSDPGVRLARLMNHRLDIVDEAAAQDLLTRLDEGAGNGTEGATVVDVGARPAGAAALDILWHLLPASRRPDLSAYGLSGRAPLHS